MPELAEVEYYRKQWDAGLGSRIKAVQLHAQKRIFRGSDPEEIRRCLTSAQLLRSTARGKQMLFAFSGGNWLGLHLGMSGTLRTEAASFRPAKHDHQTYDVNADAGWHLPRGTLTLCAFLSAHSRGAVCPPSADKQADTHHEKPEIASARNPSTYARRFAHPMAAAKRMGDKPASARR